MYCSVKAEFIDSCQEVVILLKNCIEKLAYVCQEFLG
jgi:hypothetical protein